MLACKLAGIERIPHDFRRTAVWNLERAGVPRTTAMAMIGHKTESTHNADSLVREAERLWEESQPTRIPLVVYMSDMTYTDDRF
jgi:integrase